MADLIEGVAWPAGIYQLETDDPVLGGPPNLVTLDGIDNVPHLLLAQRTQWLRRFMMSFNSTRSILAGATALGVTDIGRLHFVTAAATITLPDTTAVGAGAALHFAAAAAATITAAGTDVIVGLGAASVTTAQVGVRGSLSLVSNGAGAWIATGGTAQLAASDVFSAQVAAIGHEVLPSGKVQQWGAGTLPASGQPTSSVTITLPKAWSTGLFSGVAAAREFANTSLGAAPAMLVSFNSLTQITFLGDTLSSTPFNKPVSFFWQAIGK